MAAAVTKPVMLGIQRPVLVSSSSPEIESSTKDLEPHDPSNAPGNRASDGEPSDAAAKTSAAASTGSAGSAESAETKHDEETLNDNDVQNSTSHTSQAESAPHRDGESAQPKNSVQPSAKKAKQPSSPRSELKEIAIKLFNEDFVSIVPEEYTQFLAAHDPDSAVIREYYMDMFTWDPSLVVATRSLCSKLYLKGESQEIDRILSAFTKSYLKQHPVNVFCTQDFEKIYIVLYSLILLNTALHNTEVDKKSKLSQSDYIRNTLTTFLSQNKKASRSLTVRQKIQIERELNNYYEDLSKKELYLKGGESESPSPKKQPNTNRYSIVETIRSSVSGNAEPDSTYGSPTIQKNTDVIDLSRQPSNTSKWSVDGDNGVRRSSLAMKRMSSSASAATTTSVANSFATVHGNGSLANSRFGFTRALLADNAHRANTHPLRNQKSTDHLRNVTRRSSRASMITKESTFSSKSNDDELSLMSVGDLPHLSIDADGIQNQYEVDDFDVDDFQDHVDLKLELQGAPYLKEGLLKLRILNNDLADSTAASDVLGSSASNVSVSAAKSGFFSFFRHNKDQPVTTALGTGVNTSVFSSKSVEYFVVVSKGELRLYSFDPKVIKKHQQKIKKIRKQRYVYPEVNDQEPEEIGDGNWLNSAANIGNYNLCSTFAQVEKNIAGTQDPSKRVTWSLTFPKTSKKPAKKFLFEAGTVEVAGEFINTCNFWASKLTAVPTLEESMSSIEYGWTNLDSLLSLDDTFKKTKSLSKWEPLPKGVYLSNYISSEDPEQEFNNEGMLKQFVQTLKYYNNLKNVFNNFNRQKIKFMKHFRKLSGCSNYKLVVGNYEARSEEYKLELTKYKSYVAMLGYGLKLRFDLEEEEEETAWIEEINGMDETKDDEAITEELKKRRLEAANQQSELVKAVKKEITKLAQNSSSMRQLLDENAQSPHQTVSTDKKLNTESTGTQTESSNAPLVKSPKTFSFSNFKENESSPINQLLSVDGKMAKTDHEQGLNLAKKELIMSFSTNTIREEDEPED